MIAPAIVHGRPLSRRDHDRIWSAFCTHGITPVFHVADQPRVFDDAWYTDEKEALVPVVETVFLHVARFACTRPDLNGTLERFPELRIGIVELSAVWVPMYLMMLDGGYAFTSKMNGTEDRRLPIRPSDYFRRQVRVSSFAYEGPVRLGSRSVARIS